MSKLLLLALTLGMNFLSGCIAVPVPTFQEAPYQREKLPELEIGESTRAEVLFGLGEPNAVYENERLFLYTKLQTHFVWLIAVGAGYQAEMAILPGAQTRYYLGAWFDLKNRLSHLEAIPLREHLINHDAATGEAQIPPDGSKPVANCFKNGLCFANSAGTALYALPELVKPAAPSSSSNCRLVLFVDCGPVCAKESTIDPHSIKLTIDGRPVGPQVADGYYDFHVRPGRHIVAATGRKRGFIVLNREIHRRKLICKPPGPVYRRLSLSSGETEPFNFAVIDDEATRTALDQRRLLLRRWQSENFPVMSRMR